MPSRQNRTGWIFWALAGFAVLSGCLKEPGEEYYLRLTLNDSLSRYDSVEIVLVSATDTSAVLARVFQGPLPNPRGLERFRLPDGLTEADFQVRVRAFLYEGQLALQTNIGKSGSNLSIIHGEISATPSPYLVNLNSLEIFPTKLIVPAFDTGTTDYEILIPLNLDTVQIYPNVADTRAKMYIDSDTAAWFLFPPLFRPVSFTPTLMSITIKNNNRQKVYRLSFRKDSRGGPHLTALRTSPGTSSPAFNPDSLSYSATVTTTDSVFRFDSLAAESGAEVILNNRDTILAGSLPPPQPLSLGNNPFTIRLSKNGGIQVYTLNVYREHPPQLVSFRTTPNFWSPAFQPAALTYIMSSNGVSQLVFDSMEVAPGCTAYVAFNSTTNFNKFNPGTLPGPFTPSTGTDIIRIRVSKPGLVNPPIYIFTLTP